MRSDAKTLFTSAAIILTSIIVFEIGKFWKIIGGWDAERILPLIAGELGQFIGYSTFIFLFVFTAAIIFIQKPSRSLARKSLVVSFSICAIIAFIDGLLILTEKFSFLGLASPPTGAVIGGGLYLFCHAVHGAIKGFHEDGISKEIEPGNSN